MLKKAIVLLCGLATFVEAGEIRLDRSPLNKSQTFLLYESMIAPSGSLKILAMSPTSDLPRGDGNAEPLLAAAKKLDVAIEASAKKNQTSEADTGVARSKKQEALKAEAQSSVGALAGIRLQGAITVVDVRAATLLKARIVGHDAPRAPYLVYGKIRLIQGLSPVARKQIADEHAKIDKGVAASQKNDRKTMDSVRKRKQEVADRITEADSRLWCATVYFFGGEELADVKKDAVLQVSGVVRTATVFTSQALMDPDSHIEIELIKDSNAPAPQPQP